MVHVTKNVHCIAYFGKIKQISKKGTRSLQLVILFTAGEHQLKDDWGFFMVFLEAQIWFCSQFLRANVAYCLKITVGNIQYKSGVHFKTDLETAVKKDL